MEFRAISRFVRISPRKTRLVADLVRGENAIESQQLLETVNKRAARIIGTTLNSAISNARQKEVEEESLWIKKIVIDGGPLYKRYMPRAMGRATMIRHTTSHITVVLSDEKRILKGKEEVTKKEELEVKEEKEHKAEGKKGKVKVKEKTIPKKESFKKRIKEKPKLTKEKKVNPVRGRNSLTG